MKDKEQVRRWLTALGRCKYVLLVIAVGLLLLLWPTGGEEPARSETAATAGQEDPFRLSAMEHKLEQALSQVEGAGRVTVVLALKESPRQVLAQNGAATEGESQTSRETSLVLASKGTGTQEPVKLQELAPQYQGALVVAEGGSDPQVRLALSEAVSALTGLGADKITICKGK